MKIERKTLGLGLVKGVLGVAGVGLVCLGALAWPAGGASYNDPNIVWKIDSGDNIPAATETNLPTTADLGWVDLRGAVGLASNVFLALTGNMVTDGTSSNLCQIRFAPSLDRVRWETNLTAPAVTVRFALTNRVPGTLMDQTVMTNGAFFGATPYPFYRVVNVTNMTAKWMSNAVLRFWSR